MVANAKASTSKAARSAGGARLIISAALLASSGCFARYESVADVSQEQRRALERADAYYLQKAKEQASFASNCPSNELSVTIVSTKRQSVAAQDSDEGWFVVNDGRIITHIGAEGCGQRGLYLVLCGPHQSYGAPTLARVNSFYGLCDVIPSSEAARLVDQNNREQQLLDDEARQAQQRRSASPPRSTR